MKQVYQKDFEEVISRCQEEIKAIRAARATPALVENIFVQAYETRTPIEQLASITTPDPRTIVIQPWDKSIIKNIEEAIRVSDIGLNPNNEGELIRLVLPSLTQERRTELVRNLNKKLEDYRIRIRQLRDKIREEILSDEKKKEISEDDKYRLFEELDAVTKDYTDKIKNIGESKEADIMRV